MLSEPSFFKELSDILRQLVEQKAILAVLSDDRLFLSSMDRTASPIRL